MTQRRFFASIAILAASNLGCQPIVPTNNAGEAASIDESATDLQQITAKATAAGEAAAQIFAIAGASISAMDDLSEMLNGFGPSLSCPNIELGDPGLPLDITFDYGSGCNASAPAPAQLSGALAGRLFGANSYSVTTENLTHADKTVSGSIVGGFSSSSSITTYQFTISLATDEWPVIGGGGVLEFDADANTMSITQGSLAVRNTDDESFSVELEGVLIGVLEDGRIAPMGGTASVLVHEAQFDSDPSAINVDLGAISGK